MPDEPLEPEKSTSGKPDEPPPSPENPELPHEHEQEAAKLAFDITKQFITIAIGGIAFVVGLYSSSPTAVSSFLLWTTVVVFGLSALFGLVFLMHGVSLLSIDKSYDVYATGLRFLSIFQIVLVFLGVILFFPILYKRPTSPLPSENGEIRIQLSPQQSISYPVPVDKNYVIEIDGTKVKISATRP